MIGDENPPQNPVLVVHRRGGDFEVCHRGAFAVLSGERVIRSAGSFARSYFARSATKPFQALPLLVNGGGERFALTPAETAVITSSHGGEPMHVAAVTSLLAKGGRSADELQCGTHAPMHEPSARELVKRGERPNVLHNNCSGKHTGMLLQCVLSNTPCATYLDPEHPIQREIRSTVIACTEIDAAALRVAVDGCSAPTFELPLAAMARGFRNLTNPQRLPPKLAAAARTLLSAVQSEPLMIAGHDRFDSALIAATSGRLFCKGGAEGFLALGVVGCDLGLAIKIDDGATRGYVPVVLKLLTELDLLTAAESVSLQRYSDPLLRNHAGLVIGERELVF